MPRLVLLFECKDEQYHRLLHSWNIRKRLYLLRMKILDIVPITNKSIELSRLAKLALDGDIESSVLYLKKNREEDNNPITQVSISLECTEKQYKYYLKNSFDTNKQILGMKVLSHKLQRYDKKRLSELYNMTPSNYNASLLYMKELSGIDTTTEEYKHYGC